MMRITGLDLARGFALLAVFVAHTAPIGPNSPVPLNWLEFADDIAAPLFTTLVGVSAGLAVRNAAVAGPVPRGRLVVAFAVRGVLLIVLGLLAGLAGATVIPILHYLGAVTLLLLPVLFLRPRWLVALSAAMVIVSSLALEPASKLHKWLMIESIVEQSLWAELGKHLVGFFFADYGYRVSSLLVWALAGLAISRLVFAERQRIRGLAVAGLALLVAATALSTVTGGTLSSYSGTAPELLKSLGLACTIIALSCWLASTPFVKVLGPVITLGSMTLTFYLAHIAALGLWTRLTGMTDDKWSILFALCAGSLITAALIRRRWRRGPLEWLMAQASSASMGRRLRPA